MKFYTCVPTIEEVEKNSEGYQKWVKSVWCGEGYDTRKDANFHKNFLQKTFCIKFVIEKEEL